MLINSTRFRVTLSFGVDELLFGKCDKQLVSVLAVTHRDKVRGVDFIQYRNLGIQVWIC